MGRRRKNIIQSVSFVDITGCRFNQYDLEFIDQKTYFQFDESEVRNSVVKLKIKYIKSNEGFVNEFVNKFVNKYSKVAKHICRPDKIIINDRRIDDMVEKDYVDDPTIILDVWLKQRVILFDTNKVKKELKKYFSQVEQSNSMYNTALLSIDKIQLGGFMPFRDDNQVVLYDGLYNINGNYGGVDNRSNRSGKSAFLESISVGLFGRGRKIRTNSMFIHSEKRQYNIVLNLKSKKGNFIIKRTGNKLKQELSIDGNFVGARKGLEKIQDEIVGMNFEDFQDICFARQGRLRGILESRSSELTDMFMRWCCIDEFWNTIGSLVNLDTSISYKEYNDIKFKYEKNKELMEVDVDSDYIEKIKGEIIDLEKLVALSNKNEMKKDLDIVVDKITMLEKIKKAQEVYVDVVPICEEIGLIEQKRDKLGENLDDVKQKVNTLLNDTQNRQNNLDYFDGTCPIDDHRCSDTGLIADNIQKQKKIIGGLVKNIRVLRLEKNILHDKIGDCIDQIKVLGDKKDCSLVYKKLAEQKYGKDEHVSLLKTQKILQQKMNKEMVAVQLESELNGKRRELTTLLIQQESYNRAIDQDKKMSKQVEDLYQEYKFKKYIQFICSKSGGIPSMQIRNILLVIENKTNKYLEMIGVDFRLRFEFYLESGKKATSCFECGHVFEKSEHVCQDCGEKRGKQKIDYLNVNVVDVNGIHSFEQDSGGGKDIIAIAFRAALSNFFGIKVLFFDEVCGNLDKENLDLFLIMVNKLLEGDFDQIFVISHNEEIVNAIDNKITIIRCENENYSTVVCKTGLTKRIRRVGG